MQNLSQQVLECMEQKRNFLSKHLKRSRDNVLTKEIVPTLEKLRKERVQYVQQENVNAKVEKLKRFWIAYEFVQATKVIDDVIYGVEQTKSKVLELKNSMEQIELEIDEKEKAILDVSAKKENQLGGDMKVLCEKVDKFSKLLVKRNIQIS